MAVYGRIVLCTCDECVNSDYYKRTFRTHAHNLTLHCLCSRLIVGVGRARLANIHTKKQNTARNKFVKTSLFSLHTVLAEQRALVKGEKAISSIDSLGKRSNFK